MKAAIGVLSALIVAGGVTTVTAQERAPRAFLELFTSQGCSTCPPADALIAQLDRAADTVAVTMPVTLWDWLGWQDTLAHPKLTDRQIAYSVARGDREIYTPQLVVNGGETVVGSDVVAVQDAVDKATRKPLPLELEMDVRDGVLNVSAGSGGEYAGDEATLWLLVTEKTVVVPISGGENRGRKLTYHNVVRHMRPIGMWKGKAMSLSLPLMDLEKNADYGCVVVAQLDSFKGPGEIIGVAEVDRIFPARTIAERL